MKASKWLQEELDVNGVLRYDSERGYITTQTKGPGRERGFLFQDLQKAIEIRDRYNEAIESMESFLGEKDYA
jgi:hypothetical protein